MGPVLVLSVLLWPWVMHYIFYVTSTKPPSFHLGDCMGEEKRHCVPGTYVMLEYGTSKHWLHSESRQGWQKWQRSASTTHTHIKNHQLLLMGLLGDSSVSVKVPEMGSALICKWPSELMFTVRSCRGGWSLFCLEKRVEKMRNGEGHSKAAH